MQWSTHAHTNSQNVSKFRCACINITFQRTVWHSVAPGAEACSAVVSKMKCECDTIDVVDERQKTASCNKVIEASENRNDDSIKPLFSTQAHTIPFNSFESISLPLCHSCRCCRRHTILRPT